MNPKVLFVLNSLGLGGAERHTVELATYLATAGTQVRVAFGHSTPAGLAPMLDEAGIDSVPLRNAGSHVAAAVRLHAMVNAFDPDVIVACNQYPNALAAASRVFARRRCPLVCVMHSMALPQRSGGWLGRMRDAALDLALVASDHLVFVSERQATFWRSGLRARLPHSVIRTGIDVDRFFRVRQTRARARSELRLQDEAWVVACCAGLRVEKRHDLLLEACARAARAGRPIDLLLVGDGPMRGDLEARARALGIGDRVRFLGFRADVRPVLAAADAFALPSDFEALPIALMEAAAGGLPIVATNVGGVSEVVIDGETGLLIPRGDADALANALERLRDLPFATAISTRAQGHARAQFAADRMRAAYAHLFAGLATTARERFA